jgi:hypothetical protein
LEKNTTRLRSVRHAGTKGVAERDAEEGLNQEALQAQIDAVGRTG